ncbi:MAG: hypothetical protein FWD25_05070 [Clostridia bacterium]|nr:hypothetical protein [Clostridia bacterium]
MIISPHSPRTLTHLLLWTPWDKKINADIPKEIREALNMNKKLFYRDCFVPLETAHKGPNEWGRLGSLFDNVSLSPTVIKSFSGVGKSTMLHAMLEDKGIHETAIILDALKTIDVFPDGGWNNWLRKHCREKPMHEHLIKLLLEALYILLGIPITAYRDKCAAENKTEEQLALEQLGRIVKNLQTYFRDLHVPFEPALTIIEQYLSGAILYNSQDSDRSIAQSYSRQMAVALFLLYGTGDNPADVMKHLLELLCVLAICNMKDPTEDRVCVAFDNIEHFLIDDTIIQDKEIQSLLDMLNQGDGFIDEQNSYFRNRYDSLTKNPNKEEAMIFSERIWLVLVLREFTADMQSRKPDAQGNDDDCTISLHNQIPLQEIIRKRVDFVLKVANVNLRNDEPVSTVIKILEDGDMAKRISQMFSYDKRKAVRNLIDAFYQEEVKDKPIPRTDLLRSYNRLATQYEWLLSKGNLRNAYRHGQRQLVFRALYDSMLDNLRPGGNKLGIMLQLNNFHAERGSVRQILVYLARRDFYPSDEQLSSEKPMARLSDLIRYIYLKPNEAESDDALWQFPDNHPKAIKDLAKILNTLRYHHKYERLSPLILLRFSESGSIDEHHIERALIKICKNPALEINGDVLEYGVKCTIAGRMFVEYCPSFEFVTARHYESLLEKPQINYSEPLFVAESNTVKAFTNYVDTVSKLTLENCIDEMVKKALYFITPLGGVPEYYRLYDNKLLYQVYDFQKNEHDTEIALTHAERLITHHIRYIDHFRLYAVDCLRQSGHSVDEMRQLSFRLLDIIERYIDKLCDLTENYSTGNQTKQFFIGGTNRKTHIDWGATHRFGYKKYLNELGVVRANPLGPYCVAPDLVKR